MAQSARFLARTKAIEDVTLDHGAARLYLKLDDMARDTGCAWPRQGVLADFLDADPRTIRRWIAVLVSAGYLTTERESRNSRYCLCWYKQRTQMSYHGKNTGHPRPIQRALVSGQAGFNLISEAVHETGEFSTDENLPETPKSPALCGWCHDSGYCGSGSNRGPCGACVTGRSLRRRA